MPRLSIVVPIYNVEHYVERCVRSLFEQTLDDIEYIFVDDCTPDNSVDKIKRVLEEYPTRQGRVKFVHHTKNKGLTAARNSGLSLATGEFIAHCDSDDWVSHTMYEELLRTAEETASDLVYCDFYMVYPGATVEYNNLDVFENKKQFLRKYMTTGWTSIWNLIAKRKLYVDYNLESPKNFTYCEDFYLSVKLMYFAKSISKVNSPLYFYNRENETSLLHRRDEKACHDELLCYSEIIDFFTDYSSREDFIKEILWKVISCTRDWILKPEMHQRFCEFMPEKSKYILSCPLVSNKTKIIMWMLTHNMRCCVLLLLYIKEKVNKRHG